MDANLCIKRGHGIGICTRKDMHDERGLQNYFRQIEQSACHHS